MPCVCVDIVFGWRVDDAKAREWFADHPWASQAWNMMDSDWKKKWRRKELPKGVYVVHHTEEFSDRQPYYVSLTSTNGSHTEVVGMSLEELEALTSDEALVERGREFAKKLGARDTVCRVHAYASCTY
ncbi:hypothetical protein KIPB_005031 [Kipferlia bialata]|uniref:Uncharacterized protein n=1 Tax=Kipferlia bialata TaxID=797122 RepID=A0A391NR68_9EUKA|nr:hypothetical protein KIPB_005031 [Kipferlia bialata]|eukprot:g5031.t1